MKRYSSKTIYERAIKRWENEGGSTVTIKSSHKSDEAIKIWAIGHSTRALSDFLELLKENKIESVVDVRSDPSSRKCPQFNADVLACTLEENKIEFFPLTQLAGRRRALPDSPNTVSCNEAFPGYADYMEASEFTEGIAELLELARRKRTSIMCAEAVWWRCHRSMISDYLKASGVTVEHILDGGKNVIHPFASAAKIKDGRLVYEAAEPNRKPNDQP